MAACSLPSLARSSLRDGVLLRWHSYVPPGLAPCSSESRREAGGSGFQRAWQESTGRRGWFELNQTALDARRQRIVISESTVGAVKWAGILLQGLCTLVAIAMVHSDNRLTCAITLTLFATGIALSVLLIAAYSRPFTGETSVRPELLRQVIVGEAAVGTSR